MAESGEALDPELIQSNLDTTNARVRTAAEQAGKDPTSIRLVAVSKRKPLCDVITAYEAGQRYFGENYVNELVDKSQSEELSARPDIKFHFIGSLQLKNVNKLVKSTPHLDCVETVSEQRIAEQLNRAVEQSDRATTPLKVFVQANVSNDENKSGCRTVEEVQALCSFITTACPNLVLAGLMTIGAAGDLSAFPTLREWSEQAMTHLRGSSDVLEALQATGRDLPEMFELSMGMSADFEQAIADGSTNVRVGSTIFGARPPMQNK